MFERLFKQQLFVWYPLGVRKAIEDSRGYRFHLTTINLAAFRDDVANDIVVVSRSELLRRNEEESAGDVIQEFTSSPIGDSSMETDGEEEANERASVKSDSLVCKNIGDCNPIAKRPLVCAMSCFEA